MNLKDAILKSLEEIDRPTNHIDIYRHIVSKKYYDFTKAKTPLATISSRLGDFIRHDDPRVKRMKNGSAYSYYFKKNNRG